MQQGQEEKVIFRKLAHWLMMAGPEVAVGILGFFLIRYLPLLAEFLDYHLPLRIWLILGGILFFIALVIFLQWLCISYTLTNQRLIDKRGIIGRRIISIPLDKIQDVTCRFGICGRIFGFGDVKIKSAGTFGEITFHFIPSPRRFKEKIIEARQIYGRGNYRQTTAPKY